MPVGENAGKGRSMKRRELVALFAAAISEPVLAFSQRDSTGHKFGNISLIRLIANPSAFDGQRFRVVGYLANNGLDRALGLYISEADGRNFIVSNSVDLSIEESAAKNLVGKYVVLDGTYHAPSEKALSLSNGHFDRIADFKSWRFGDAR